MCRATGMACSTNNANVANDANGANDANVANDVNDADNNKHDAPEEPEARRWGEEELAVGRVQHPPFRPRP